VYIFESSVFINLFLHLHHSVLHSIAMLNSLYLLHFLKILILFLLIYLLGFNFLNQLILMRSASDNDEIPM